MFYNNPATCAAFQARRSWEAKAQCVKDGLSQSPMGQARGRASQPFSWSFAWVPAQLPSAWERSCVLLTLYLKDRSYMYEHKN